MTSSYRSDRPLTPAVFHVLLALADGPCHGYAVMQAARGSAGRGTPMGPSTVYGTLQRLIDAELVRELDGPPAGEEQVEDDRRRFFELTAEGLHALRGEAWRVTRLAELVHDRRLVPGAADD